MQVDESRRFVRCSCGVTAPVPLECAVLDRQLETIVGRLKRLEETLAADLDRLRASCTRLDGIGRGPVR
jgi:hypothetical protein